MVKRTASCIGFDEENLIWVRTRPEGMAEWINKVIKAYREDPSVRSVIGNRVLPEAAVETNDRVALEERLAALKKVEADDEIKIRAYLLDNKHIMYMAKTQRKFTKKDLCKIKDELFFSKYNLDTNTTIIRKVLKEEMGKFDVKAYEREIGKIP